MIGQILDKYRIVGTIGKGGMGVVYLAEHTLIGRKAALKVLLPQYSHDQRVVGRFFNEARAASAIRHPGIVEIYDFGYASDRSAYIIMEYLEGEPLGERVRGGPMPAAAAVGVARQIASALAAAHDAGIVHRDLKPDNVFVVRDPDIAGGERIKLLDFGIAKLIDEATTGSFKTRTGSVMGTPAYMSPEQCKGAGEVDHRSDLYALGCVLFQLLAGRPPFLARGGGEVIAKHIYEPAPDVRAHAAASDALAEVIARLLAKDPEERPASARAVAGQLASVPEAAGAAEVASAVAEVAANPGSEARIAPTEPQRARLAHGGAATADTTPALMPPETAGAPAGDAGEPGDHEDTTLGSSTGARAAVRARRRPLLWLAAPAVALVAGGAVAALGPFGGSSSVSRPVSGSRTVAAGEADAGEPAPAVVVTPLEAAQPGVAPSPAGQVTVIIESEPAGATVYRRGADAADSRDAAGDSRAAAGVAPGVGAGEDALGPALGVTPYRGTAPRGDGDHVYVLRREGYRDATIALPGDVDIYAKVPLAAAPPATSRGTAHGPRSRRTSRDRKSADTRGTDSSTRGIRPREPTPAWATDPAKPRAARPREPTPEWARDAERGARKPAGKPSEPEPASDGPKPSWID